MGLESAGCEVTTSPWIHFPLLVRNDREPYNKQLFNIDRSVVTGKLQTSAWLYWPSEALRFPVTTTHSAEKWFCLKAAMKTDTMKAFKQPRLMEKETWLDEGRGGTGRCFYRRVVQVVFPGGRQSTFDLWIKKATDHAHNNLALCILRNIDVSTYLACCSSWKSLRRNVVKSSRSSHAIPFAVVR